jgi:hypothetical protein
LPPVNVDRACYDRFMTGRTWRFTVHDARGRAQDGVVVYASRVADMPPLAANDAFGIVLLEQPRRITQARERTAICVPAALRVRPVGGLPALHLPDAIESLTLPPYRMTAFAQGTMITPSPVAVTAADVFPAHSDHPRLDRLALALCDAAESEGVATYAALVRHELALAPGADPLFELEERLAPADPAQRPPAKAPGIVRLRAVAANLREHQAPAVSLEQFAEDLRLLRKFARDDDWPAEALERLLGDVQPARVQPPRKRSRVTPLPRRPREGS